LAALSGARELKQLRMKRVLWLLVWTAGAYFAGLMILKAALIALGRTLYLSSYTFYAPAVVLWLMCIAPTLLALHWSFISIPRRFWPAAVSSALAIGISCSGLKRIHIVSTTTVNGHITSRFEFKWLFVASLVLAALTLAYTFWKRRQSNTII
jgi:hypothetical protein